MLAFFHANMKKNVRAIMSSEKMCNMTVFVYVSVYRFVFLHNLRNILRSVCPQLLKVAKILSSWKGK